MKKLFLMSLAMMLFVFNSQASKNETSIDANETAIQDVKEEVNTTKNNYAVVWHWKSKDRQLIMDNFDSISNELQELWNNDVVENVYLDSEAEFAKEEKFPNISFFIKAKDISEAELILNKLTVVTKGIATFSIYPVGLKWLGRNTDEVYENITANCYVSVWKPMKDFKEDGESIKSQFDAVVDLWNRGIVENIYFDMENTDQKNEKADFVFFIHADTEKEAKKILKELPFVKNKLTSYKLYPAGIFWLGVHSNTK